MEEGRTKNRLPPDVEMVAAASAQPLIRHAMGEGEGVGGRVDDDEEDREKEEEEDRMI